MASERPSVQYDRLVVGICIGSDAIGNTSLPETQVATAGRAVLADSTMSLK